MRGVATIDRRPDSDQIAVWVTSATAFPEVGHVNAVVMPADGEETLVKVRSLTRCCVVLATDGSALEGLPIEGDPLHTADLATLSAETEAHQERILAPLADYKRRTRSNALVEPTFLRRPEPENFQPSGDSSSARAFAAAEYLREVWRVWLKSDEERVRRTVQPRSGTTPWIMPEDMNEPTTPAFPAGFAARVTEQAVV